MRLPDIPTVPVADIEIPPELSRLADLAYNLWWTWTPRARRLFATIDPIRWRRYHNPVELLINVEPRRWGPLLLDPTFTREYNAVIDELDRYLAGVDRSWFRQAHAGYGGGPVAYFSTEYGWHESLGIYSGGLGVLSGDHCKAASDAGLPFVGIGLVYERGYFRQTIDADGNQQHDYPNFDVRRLPVRPVAGPGDRELRVAVPLGDRTIQARVWKAIVGRVPVLLLDTDVRDNDPADRPITSFLYVRGREMRLCQEIVLGIGGARALRALGITPSVWHVNEGHSALLAFDRVEERVRADGVSLGEALRRTAGNAVFTTHTPVPAGNEVFDTGLARGYLEPMAIRIGVPVEQLLAMGRAAGERDDGTFNLTALAIRTTSQANGVSELHGRVASSLWRHLWSDGRPDPIGHVTNGVHVPTWIGREVAALLRAHVSPDVDERLLDLPFAEAVARIPDAELWAAHCAQKRRLVTFARERVLEQFARHGRAPRELGEVSRLLDPEVLTIGFGRRFATYKRADLLFRDTERLRGLLRDPHRPVQVIYAGKAHPADRPGQELIRRIFQASLSAETFGRVVFLEDYDMRIARYLVQGVDVWLNNPRRPEEASGTSGMKAAVNGALNVSVLDGWWCEGYDPAHGWAIGEAVDHGGSEARDRSDAQSLLDLLAREVVPTFYRRDPGSGLPRDWIGRMKRAIGQLTPRFSAARMLREYTTAVYLPASERQGWGTGLDEVRLWSS